MSNRLTFSLASLTLIFALAFVASPAMAATGGPTVTFEEYSGVEDPAVDPSTQTAPTAQHTQERGDFRVKVTFSDPVRNVVAGDFNSYIGNQTAGFGAPTALTTLTNVWTSANTTSQTEYVLTVLSSAPAATDTRVYVSIAEDMANRISDNVGNVPGQSEIYTLPPLLAPVTVKFGDVEPVANSNGQQYTVLAIFEDATDTATNTLGSLTTGLITDTTNNTSSYITVMPDGNATVTIAAGVEGADGDATPSGVGEFTHLLTVSLAFGVDPIDGVTVGIDPGYALMVDGSTATVAVSATNMPPTYPANTEAAMVTGMVGTAITAVAAGGATDPEGDPITYSWDAADGLGLMLDENTGMITGTPAMAYDNDAGSDAAVTVTAAATGGTAMRGVEIVITAVPPTVDSITVSNLNEAERTFRLKVVLSGAMPALTGFTKDNLKATDMTDAPVTLTADTGNERFTASNQTYDAILGYDALAELPLTVTTADDFDIANATPVTATVGETGPPANAPATPAAPTAMTNAANDLIIDVSWTAPADNGSAITGYTVKKYSGTTLVKTFPDDDPNTTAITGTSYSIGPVPEADRGMSFTFTVTAMNANGSSMESAMSASYTVPEATPANNPPVVAISTAAPTTAQTVSFAIAYTVTDADAGDTYTVAATHDGGTGYSLDTSTTNMVTIMQAKGSAAANVTVTITATDSAGGMGSAMLAVIFAERPADPAPVMPTAPILSAVPGDKQVTLNWEGATGTITGYQYSLNEGLVWIDVPNSTAATRTYTVKTHADGTTRLTNGQSYNFIVRAINATQMGPASNEITATPQAAVPVTDTTPPTVTAIRAAPNPINCETGSTLSFRFSEALGTGEAIAASELTVSAGWKAMADGGAIKIVPMGDGSEIGVTTVSVSVNAGAVKDAAGNGNTASAATMFTVGPVLTIPAGGYIVVIRPEHMFSTHLRDPLYIGSTGVRAPIVDIQTWECMPDLTIFFGRAVPAIGGGAIVIKEADGPMGHDPGGTLADIAKGSVGLSEIMWASDEGVAHGGIPSGGRSNIDQTREQWIELHNRNNTAVKVTLFARPTNSALTTEADELDRVSNYNLNNVWAAPGQSGNSELGIDFVSMQRGKHDNKGLAPNQAAGYAHGDWNGTHANRWSASTISYLTRPAGLRNTGQIAADNLLYDFLGTPGRNNKPAISTPLLRTNVPKNTIVFNEIANRRDQTLEWIELKNVSDAEVNLKKYQISIATAKGTDHVFYNFPDNDNIKLAAGEILLLLDTDPRDNDAHPIAVAFNRDGGNDQALGIGADAIKYKVANFREGGLPDDGNFVLYLRNGNDKLGQAAKVIDLIGWSNNLADASKHTKVWPLNIFGEPDARNKIEVERVHRRQHRIDPDKNTHGDDKDEHQALRDVGYSGIGYKRHAQNIAANGGTPGHEDTRKNLVADISATGVLTISEIMYAQGDGEYPQWIEIYNSSATQPVNLHSEAGWRLIIENFDDGEIPVATLSGTLNFKNSEVQTILPQQTVVVASTRARNSGSAFFDTRVVFPDTRVFAVWADQRDEFGMKRSTDPILSERGFYIELIDGKGNFSDGVGNLVKSPNRRVAATIEWELADINGGMEDEGRSSILRRYREYKDGNPVGPYTAAEVEDMGVMADGWVAAYMTDFRDVRQTWYGHPDDYGSPGITGGRVLPVELSKFRPERLDSGEIVIRWITQSELNNAGFNILRSEERNGEYKQINTKLIAGQGTTSERTTYEWKDTSAKPNVVYYYQIQDVSLDGKVATLAQTRLKGHVSPAGKATTTWGELKALQ